MSTETPSAIINQPKHTLFITTRPSRNTQMPNASHEIAARRMIELAWAEEHGMDVTRLMENGTDTSTTCKPNYPSDGGLVADDNDTDGPVVPILY